MPHIRLTTREIRGAWVALNVQFDSQLVRGVIHHKTEIGARHVLVYPLPFICLHLTVWKERERAKF